uniref:diguanylate cyclase domain-containing protein n=1 Tax=Escherichia coli TaxID=562 RepID=UPI00244AED4C
PKTSIICSPMTSLKTSIKIITYLSDIGCLEIQGASLESEVQQICSALTQIFNLPFDLHNGHQTTMTLSIGYAMTIEHASAEKLQELADHNMYQAKHQRAEKLVR